MKLLLCSDFSSVGYKWLDKFFNNPKGLNCLYVGYAQEDEFPYESSAAKVFEKLGINVTMLEEGYKFEDKIDMIFVRGGNTTRLIHYLRKYSQYEKIKKMAESGVLYIGNSAGAVLAGNDTEWTLEAEPYEPDLKPIFGENALKGFGWINKMVFVHCTRYRMSGIDEQETPDDVFRTLDTWCYPAYLKDCRKYKKEEYVRLGNNQAYYEKGNDKKILTFNWKNIPFKKIEYQN